MKITVESLSKRYNKSVLALNNINLELNGGVLGLIGRNGAGKTTLMRILATAIKQTEGDVKFDGKDIFKNLKEYRASLGYLPQTTSLMPTMNIYEFLDYMCVLKKITEKSKRMDEIERVVNIVGLEDEKKKRLGKYSGGMLRRAGIAQALIGSPALLIIDEPTTGLDPEERLYFLNLLSQISYAQTTLLSTHIIHDIESICENICVLEKGTMIYSGPTSGLVSTVKDKVWQITCTPQDAERLRAQNLAVSIAYVAGKPVVRYISDCSIIDGSELVTATLEDAYIHSLGGVKR